MQTVAVLFARKDSVYKSISGCDVFDKERDALTFARNMPVVAHPPCRAWGRLRTFAQPSPGEMDAARWACLAVQLCGGVLEHPAHSLLWSDQNLPRPGQTDKYGGWTLPVLQKWWGHRAEKPTWLYICGISPSEIPLVPLTLGDASHVIQSSKRDHRPHVTKAEREATPLALAEWLVQLASHAQPQQVILPPCPRSTPSRPASSQQPATTFTPPKHR